VVLAALPLAQVAHAQQALVHAYGDEARPIGQAFLAHHGETCLAILPTHVMDEAGEPAAFRGEGHPARLGESIVRHDLGGDLSIAVLQGSIASECGYALSSISRAIGSHIQSSGVATLRKRTNAGTIEQRSVSLLDDPGEGRLVVRLTNSTDQVMQGDSGSLLVAGKTPIGILISYDGDDDAGFVLRMDTALRKVDRFIASNELVLRAPSTSSGGESKRIPPDQKARSAPRAKPSALFDTRDLLNLPAGGGFIPDQMQSARPMEEAPTTENAVRPPSPTGPRSERITAWSATPIDARSRAANLVATDGSGPYTARVAAWPVEIEIDLDEGSEVVLTGLRFEASGVVDAATLPGTAEIYVSLARKGSRWRVLVGSELDFRNGVASLFFAPARARQIKVVISDTQGSGNVLSIGRILPMR